MFGLSFLYPVFLIGAASAAAPIILHLLTRESAPKLPFSSLRFLKRVPVEESRRRLRELLLLALRVTLLLLLACAFARPYFAGAAAQESAGITVVAIDTSFSMSAPGQFERARRLARDAVNAAPSGPVGVVAFADSADLVAPPSTNRADALGLIARLQPGAGGTRYGAALARAAESIGARRGRIVIVTDLQQSGWQADDGGAIPEGIEVEVTDAGAPAGNLAVTDIRRDGMATIAVVRNTGAQARSTRARLVVDGRQITDVPLTAGPGVFSEVRFAQSLPSEGAVSVTVDDDEGYQPDNVRYLALDTPQPTRLLGVTSDGKAAADALYLERALQAADESSRFAWTGASAANLGTVDNLGEYAAILLLSARGLERRGRDALQSYINGGGGVLIAVGPNVEPDVLQRTVGDALRLHLTAGPAIRLSFAPVDVRHPVFRPFGSSVGNLSRVEFRQSARIAGVEGSQIIARFSNGAPALADLRVGRGRVLVFASDLNREWNDFPLHPTFVPFVHEMTRYLAAARQAPRDYLVAEAPSGVPREPGVYLLQGKAVAGSPEDGSARRAESRRVAVNVDARESDPARMTAAQFVGSITRQPGAGAAMARAEATGQEDQQGLWRYGLMAVLVSLVAEGALGRRL